ncbi:hypothetical protein [Vacuolonema iberomarrocanum]|uniref:hypothetical protein n=1 Tax=Vacuolonema iberomarrocanum TaxID=3454632 RepID=UPI001A0089DF|nr:hypothetical protein [filamentous cyanobacterium LEGE 07170]
MNKKLSISAIYCLRKTLYKYRGQLRFIVAKNAGLKAHELADLNEVIESLYLDDEPITETINQLEKLVLTYKTLKEQGELYIDYQIKIERRMLWLLGFRTLEDV